MYSLRWTLFWLFYCLAILLPSNGFAMPLCSMFDQLGPCPCCQQYSCRSPFITITYNFKDSLDTQEFAEQFEAKCVSSGLPVRGYLVIESPQNPLGKIVFMDTGSTRPQPDSGYTNLVVHGVQPAVMIPKSCKIAVQAAEATIEQMRDCGMVPSANALESDIVRSLLGMSPYKNV